MNWEAIGAIGELLSAIAVLATLIYLAVQVRNTKYELRRSFLQNRDNAVRELLLEGMRNSAFVSASSKAINTVGGGRPGLEAVKSIEGISDEEAQVLATNQVAWWFYRVETVNNIDLLPSDERDDFDRHLRSVYLNGVGKVWWDSWKETLEPDHPTRKYVEKVLDSDT